MTGKQRFLIYAHLSNLLWHIKNKKNVNLQGALEIMLENGVVEKLEDIETGYYLESDAYLERELLPNCIYDKAG